MTTITLVIFDTRQHSLAKRVKKDDNLSDNSQQHIYLFIITFLLSKKEAFEMS